MMSIGPIPLAAVADAEQLRTLLPWLGLLVLLVIAGGVVIFYVRRMLNSNQSIDSPGFTLQSLRELHAAGELTDEEFEKAKAAMIGRVAGPKETPAEHAKADDQPSDNPDSTHS